MTQYGIKTCGKLAPEPFSGFGPCIQDPDHDGLCRYSPPWGGKGYVEMSEGPFLANPDAVEVLADLKVMRHRQRIYTRVVFVASLVSIGCAIYSLAKIFL